ncbi:DNA-binding protein [Bordetella holmesii]|uniref:DNA-binding protein n=1 Tax=Bordetella holmesii TaxID=35814 RepID=UPI001A99143C|nr:DNA-binding protein [Bordetella holmesii]MBO1244502.1 DNA-binding protein [Bordetella holmesii]
MGIGIQQQDVWAAADALLRAGEQPTIERVRLHLGRGSPNTVGPHLKTWLRDLGGRRDKGEPPDAIVAAAQQLWQMALSQAHADANAQAAEQHAALRAEQAAIETQREALEADAQRLLQREADLEAALVAAQALGQAAQARAQALQQRLDSAEAELQALRQALEGAHQQLQQAERQGRDSLAAAHKLHQETLEQAEARHASHERRWLLDIDAQRQAVRRLQEEREASARTLAAREQSHTQALQAMEQQARAEGERLAAALAAASEALAGQAHWQAVAEAGERALALREAALSQRQSDLEAHAAQLLAQLAIKDEQIAGLLAAARSKARGPRKT